MYPGTFYTTHVDTILWSLALIVSNSLIQFTFVKEKSKRASFANRRHDQSMSQTIMQSEEDAKDQP